jgi:hypothetical protein
MAEYIEKHKAVNLLTSLENEFQQFKPFKGFENAMYRKLCETEIAIGQLPAADVVPVVHGWWNATETCSLCGEKSTEGLDATTWNYWLPNYCPHCGARMDGGEDND